MSISRTVQKLALLYTSSVQKHSELPVPRLYGKADVKADPEGRQHNYKIASFGQI